MWTCVCGETNLERMQACRSCEKPRGPVRPEDTQIEYLTSKASRLESANRGLQAQLEALQNCSRDLEQAQTQLAGCGVAALGGTTDPAKRGDYGWSPAYQDVLELRRAYDQCVQDLGAAVALSEKLKMEAQIHAGEVKTQRSIVLECYQAAGVNKGDWHGAESVKARIAELERLCAARERGEDDQDIGELEREEDE